VKNDRINKKYLMKVASYKLELIKIWL